jgi:chemotaxis protein MotB
MLQKITYSWLLLFVILFTSCVSSKKYKAATADAASAKASLDSTIKKNSELQSQLNDAVAGNKMLTDERDRYQKEGESAKADLKNMQGALDEYTATIEDANKKASDRLADYADRGASVENKGDAVHVNLTDELLFRKGSSKLSKDGEAVIGNLAAVLSENPNLKAVVVGHTDDRSGDGFSLSTERANAIVRALKANKIDPSRLTAAGQGQYNAVGDNSTAEGRAANRRTEVILSPTETFKLFNKK